MGVVESSTVRARLARGRGRRLGCALVPLAVLLLASPAVAAVIRLTGGGLIEAEAWREVGEEIEVSLEGGTLRIAKEDVLRIDGPPPRSVPPPAARPGPPSVAKAAPSGPSPAPLLRPVPRATPPPPPMALAPRPAAVAVPAPSPIVPPVPVAAAKAAPVVAAPVLPRLPTGAADGRAADQWQRDLASPSVEVRRRAASALAQLAERDADAIAPLLAPALKDADAKVRVAAALALGPHGREPRAVTAVLVSTLGATDVARRRTGSQALVLMGPAAKDAAPALLLAFASDPDATVRQNAATALRQIGSAAEEVVPGLTSALRHKDPAVRRAAATLLGDLESADSALPNAAPAPRP